MNAFFMLMCVMKLNARNIFKGLISFSHRLRLLIQE
ncbi:hemolysin-activating lysine-acyltransferase HlyC, partial [Escherichia coli]|nr:hemolysin-activating lysine-acyltransferase HlyC [Escherichia coli]HAG7352280.1 hemolysin-activating lysine-acyltransferase HlyC [Escherichia coli]